MATGMIETIVVIITASYPSETTQSNLTQTLSKVRHDF
jgi:hypothetical protein